MADSRQRVFLEMEGDESDRESMKRSRRRQSNVAAIDTAVVVARIDGLAAQLEARLERLEAELVKLVERSSAPAMEKEYYSTKEAAQLLGKRPYTVREWCRLGRINSVKTLSGRGIDEEWRVSHAEIQRIQNEGLLELKPGTQIQTVKRLPR